MSTWVLLRGLAREARHWGDFPARLQERTDASRVLALDLPGSGLRRAERSPSSVENLVRDCRLALERAAVPGPCLVFSLSLGGMVAAHWAARHPGEIRGAVLVNTSVRGFGSWHERLRPGNLARMLRMLCASDALRIESDVLAMTSHHPAVPGGELLERWSSWRRSHPMTRANVLRQLRAAATFRAPDPPPRVPLLVLASAADRLVDPRCSIRMARAWHTALAVHPTAGHDLPLDDPEWVLGETTSWLERAVSQARSGGAQPGPAVEASVVDPSAAARKCLR